MDLNINQSQFDMDLKYKTCLECEYGNSCRFRLRHGDEAQQKRL